MREEHAELERLVRQLGEAIALPSPPPLVELHALRRELALTLIAHLKTEDWALYPRLMECGDPEVTATAKAFSDEMGGLAAAFGVYAQRWDAMSIAKNWSGFRHESNDIIQALACRVSREDRELYPLIDRLDEAA